MAKLLSVTETANELEVRVAFVLAQIRARKLAATKLAYADTDGYALAVKDVDLAYFKAFYRARIDREKRSFEHACFLGLQSHFDFEC